MRGCSGYDAGKQVTGRKRHPVVDAEGLPLAVPVPAASVPDLVGPVGAGPVLAEAKARAPTRNWSGALGATRAPDQLRKRPGTKGFAVLPRRWVIERTLAWLGKYRRVAGRG